MQEAIAQIRTHDTHKLLSAKAAFLRLSPDEKARFARFFEAAEDHEPAGPCDDSNFSGPFRLRLARAPSSSSIYSSPPRPAASQGDRRYLWRVDEEE